MGRVPVDEHRRIAKVRRTAAVLPRDPIWATRPASRSPGAPTSSRGASMAAGLVVGLFTAAVVVAAWLAWTAWGAPGGLTEWLMPRVP